MATLSTTQPTWHSDGNPKVTSPDYPLANPSFAIEKTEKVLAQTTNTQTGVEQGVTSKPFGYYDEAGRWYDTMIGHVTPNNLSVAPNTNVPASVYPQTVLNVGARFAR
jgi:hypothetical protein